MVRIRLIVRVKVRLLNRDLVCSRGFLKFLFSCKWFYCVLECSRRFQYLPLRLWLGLGLDLLCSRGLRLGCSIGI